MRAVCVGVFLTACGVAPAADPPRIIIAGKHPVHLAFSPDGKTLAGREREPRADLRGAAGLWECGRWSEARRWSGTGGMVSSLAFSPDGKRLAVGRFDGAVEFHDLAAKVFV